MPIISLLLIGGVAHAGPSKRPETKPAASQDPGRERRTTAAVVVRRRPAASSTAIGKLAAGARVVVEREQGDWLRIRAGKLTGYVARGSVTPPPSDAGPAVAAPDPPPTKPAEPGPEPAVRSRRTIETVVIRSKPGEKQPPVGTVPTGTLVIVDAEDGRWLKVRAGKIVGYLARTSVTGPTPATDVSKIETPPSAASDQITGGAPSPDAAGREVAATGEAPAASRWSTSRRPEPGTAMTGELFVEVTAAATMRAEAKPDAGVVAELPRGARIAVIDATRIDGWVHGRDDRGHAGWIPVTQVGNGAAAVAVTGAVGGPAIGARSGSGEDGRRSSERRRPLVLRLDAAIGYRSLGMDFSSNGAAGLANYLVSADAGALDAEAVLVKRMPGRLVLGIDGRVEVSRASPGIDYPGPSERPGKIAFSTFAGDAGVRAGLRARRVFEVAVRGGLHYDAFIARDVDNAGMLPRERLLGATLGGRVEIAPPGSRVGATIRVDALVIGSRRQTAGLEDGAESTARGVWGGMAVRVRFARRWSLFSAYDFGRATTRWSGMSIREPGVTDAKRVDSTQLVRVGISAEM